jgi:predicted TIM-barrel fold metal-dependent hydrolase
MKRLFAALCLTAITPLSFAQQPPQAAASPAIDPALQAEIAKIKAIDNHAHPMKVVRPGEPADTDYDALPLDAIEQTASPIRIRPNNPEFIGAWQALFAYKYSDMAEPHVRELLAAKDAARREHGDQYSAWVLDRLGIETMLANRVALGRGLIDERRFRWVPFVDALMIPLDNAGSGNTPDEKALFGKESKQRDRYLAELHIQQMPRTLDEYLSRVVKATLIKQKSAGAIAVKFEAAYLRTLEFSDVSFSTASDIYRRYVGKKLLPNGSEYRMLQDFLFRHIAREAGSLGMPVHIHSCDGGGGSYSVSGSDPLLLESAFNDPILRGTNFVIIHGGCQVFYRHTAAMLTKPNVYADFSALTFLVSPRELSHILRLWLSYYPEKVLFGTDSFELSPEIGWEEMGWLSTTSARTALGMALTDMMNDGEITRERALELARMALRDNAIALYNLKQ